jgi:hypothetical protein
MKQIYVLMLLLFILPFSYAQVLPAQPIPEKTCDQNLIMTRVLSEHQTTRKYVNDAIQTKIDEFYKQFDGRLNYIEDQYNKMLFEAVMKLGAMMLGITLFIVSLYSALFIYFRKKTYNNLKKDILESMNKDVTQAVNKVTEEKPETKKQFFEVPKLQKQPSFMVPKKPEPVLDKVELLRQRLRA